MVRDGRALASRPLFPAFCAAFRNLLFPANKLPLDVFPVSWRRLFELGIVQKVGKVLEAHDPFSAAPVEYRHALPDASEQNGMLNPLDGNALMKQLPCQPFVGCFEAAANDPALQKSTLNAIDVDRLSIIF